MGNVSEIILRKRHGAFCYIFPILISISAVLSTLFVEKYLPSSIFFIGISTIALVSLMCGVSSIFIAIFVINLGLITYISPPNILICLFLFDTMAVGVGYLGVVARNAVARERILTENLSRERDLREKFVSSMAHDLRNPLAAATLSLQLLLSCQDESERKERLKKVVFSNLIRIDHMIQNLLDANCIKANSPLPISFSPVSLTALLSEVEAQSISLYGDRFQLNMDGDSCGYWSEEYLKRILENLISNAVKYGSQNTPILISTFSGSNSVRITVHNYGKTLSRETQENLFVPFYRAPEAISSGQPGWGLGLTLIRGLAEAHGGSVEVHSTDGDGTSFTVVLPIDSRPFQSVKQSA